VGKLAKFRGKGGLHCGGRTHGKGLPEAFPGVANAVLRPNPNLGAGGTLACNPLGVLNVETLARYVCVCVCGQEEWRRELCPDLGLCTCAAVSSAPQATVFVAWLVRLDPSAICRAKVPEPDLNEDKCDVAYRGVGILN
jgi:hypothetical protein